MLLDPDDVVLVELPTYTGAITAFRNVRARMEGVPQEDDGIDLAALDETHARLVGGGRRVRLLYVVPNFQNPTGLLIRLEKRRRLIDAVLELTGKQELAEEALALLNRARLPNDHQSILPPEPL